MSVSVDNGVVREIFLSFFGEQRLLVGIDINNGVIVIVNIINSSISILIQILQFSVRIRIIVDDFIVLVLNVLVFMVVVMVVVQGGQVFLGMLVVQN